MPVKTEDEIADIVGVAIDAFWAKIAEAFPEATAGDFPFDADFQFTMMARSAVFLWCGYNVPGYKELLNG